LSWITRVGEVREVRAGVAVGREGRQWRLVRVGLREIGIGHRKDGERPGGVRRHEGSYVVGDLYSSAGENILDIREIRFCHDAGLARHIEPLLSYNLG